MTVEPVPPTLDGFGIGFLEKVRSGLSISPCQSSGSRCANAHGGLAKTVLLHVPRNRGNVRTLRRRGRHIGRLVRR